MRWVGYVKANPPAIVLRELCQLWDMASKITFMDGQQDWLRWKWTVDGKYTATSAYRMQFHGSIPTADQSLVWKVKAAF